MTVEEAIASRATKIEVAGPKLSEALMKIREAGGFVPRMDVSGSQYVLTVHWYSRKEEQGTLL